MIRRNYLPTAVFAFALIGVALNDRVLKGSGLLPANATGNLSDVFGLLCCTPIECRR